MSFLQRFIAIYAFLEYKPDCITPNSEIMSEEADKIISNVYFDHSSSFNIVFASLFYRLNVEERCLQLSAGLTKISLSEYIFLISIRRLYHFIDLASFVISGLFKKRYLNVRIVKNLKHKNLVVFEPKKRNHEFQGELVNHGLIHLSYTKSKTKYSKYVLRLGLKSYFKVISLKITNFEVKVSFLIKYINLIDGFERYYEELGLEKEYKFLSQEGFVYDHRLFIGFFKSKKFKTYILFNNLNYGHKTPLISDYILVKSEACKNWIHPTDLDKVIVLNNELLVKGLRETRSSNSVHIGYLPELHGSRKDRRKQDYLINLIINLCKETKRDVVLFVRDHPQVYSASRQNTIMSQFDSQHFLAVYDDHSETFIDFVDDIDLLFSAYYSTGVEDAALAGVSSFVFEFLGENSMRYNVIESELLRFIKLEKGCDYGVFTRALCKEFIDFQHKLLIENLFDSTEEIPIEDALNL